MTNILPEPRQPSNREIQTLMDTLALAYHQVLRYWWLRVEGHSHTNAMKLTMINNG